MSQLFPIDDLRTLVARALQSGSYSPAESKRIRAVPDTRTIRYYTTLGLIDRASEMRGRTALYEARHVMQIVAIKRLQATNQTLSDIQATLIGITDKQLNRLAALPDGFWESAERYLARKHKQPTEPTASTIAPNVCDQNNDQPRQFWNEPAALPELTPVQQALPRSNTDNAPMVTSGAGTSVRRCMSWEPVPGIKILVDDVPDDLHIELARLQNAALPLLNELFRQGLLKATSLPPEFTP